MAEPFSILSDRYIETFLTVICYNDYIAAPPQDSKYLLTEEKSLTRRAVR